MSFSFDLNDVQNAAFPYINISGHRIAVQEGWEQDLEKVKEVLRTARKLAEAEVYKYVPAHIKKDMR